MTPYEQLVAAVEAVRADPAGGKVLLPLETAEALALVLPEGSALNDPNVVHVNMLRGGIAKPTPAQIGHLYRGKEAAQVVREVVRQNPEAAAALSLDADTPTGEAVVGLDDRLLWFLRVIEGAGGKVDAGDFPGSALAVFCDDRGEDSDDTYNLSEDRGLTRTMHSGWGDGAATVEITDEGRAFLASEEAALIAQTPATADRGDTEACGICAAAFVAGDRCLTDIDLGSVHAACCGPERESYVDLATGEPIPPGQALPEPWVWTP